MWDPALPGSARDHNLAEAARFVSQCGARAAILESDASSNMVIVPLFDVLSHGSETVKLVQLAAGETGHDEPRVALVATRALSEGDELTRDYSSTPLMDGEMSVMEETDCAKRLRLLLQCGVRPYYAGRG
jgi:hypothetical protein